MALIYLVLVCFVLWPLTDAIAQYHHHPSYARSNAQNPWYRSHSHHRHGLRARGGSSNLFDSPISTSDPSHIFGSHDHPISPPKELQGREPIHTNKFYTNMLIDGRDLSVWTHPYSFWWNKDGISLSHPGSLARFMAKRTNYLYRSSHSETLHIGALELSEGNCHFEVSEPDIMSISAHVVHNDDDNSYISLPLVYGMGMISALVNGDDTLTPTIKTPFGINQVENGGSNSSGRTHKYIIHLGNGDSWVIYSSITMSKKDENTLVADEKAFDGALIQAAHIPNQGDDAKYDIVQGRYATGAYVSGSVNGQGHGTYRIQYDVSNGAPGPLLVFALPHHVQAFSGDMQSRQAGLQLDSTVMGKMMGMYTSYLEMNEPTPDYVGFFPWTSVGKSNIAYGYSEQDADANFDVSNRYSPEVLNKIKQVVKDEIDKENMDDGTAQSMYFAGKELDKLALMTFVAKFIAQDDDSARKGLDKFRKSFGKFADNKQPHPLTYDSSWKGLVSTAGLNGDPQGDFGNTFYNDHHFHYGYYMHAAATAVMVDQALNDGRSSMIDEYGEFVDMMVRDTANPSSKDSFFPVSRSFDWYMGHSWAKGLFSSQDGRDEESSSEDYHFAYGMKLWGKVTGDAPMEGRASLMLGIMRRSMNSYMLYTDGNDILPQDIVSNKVSGILLENKIMYTTWFGSQPEYIHGIHMLPITPMSSFIRTPEFVKQEWEQKVGRLVDNLGDGWKGIIMLNLALMEPENALKFFMTSDFDSRWLDGGQSRAWSLAYCGALVG